MRISILILIQTLLVFQLWSQGEIQLKNVVTFAPYVEYGTQDTLPSIEFKIVVVNHTKNDIPDLGVTNRSKYLNFYINGEKNNPVSLYNGAELVDGKKVISPGKSAEYVISWVLSFDSGVEKYGDPFTVMWEYKGQFSNVLRVYVEDRKVVEHERKH